jgi:hypothetical protein
VGVIQDRHHGVMDVLQLSHRYATRLAIEWNDLRQQQADAAGIELFRARPARVDNWDPRWGDGNIFVGFRDDPAEVVLELDARSEHHAYAEVVTAFGVGLESFVVKPTCIGTSAE